MGTQLSGLAQLVASLEGRRDAETDITDITDLADLTDLADEEAVSPPPPPPVPTSAALEAYDEVAHAVALARQRLETLANQVTELRRLAGGGLAARKPPVG